MAVLLDKEPMFEAKNKLESFMTKITSDSLVEDQKVLDEQKKEVDLLQDNSYKYLEKNINNFDWNSTWSIGLLMRHLNVCRLIENYHLKTGKKEISLLDVGCSLGLLSDFIKDFKFFGKEGYITVDYFGIDGNENYVREAQSKGRSVAKSDLESFCQLQNPSYFPLHSYAHQEHNIERYDLIILAEVLEHVETELERFIKCLYDLLYLRGTLFVTTPNPRREIGEFLVWPDDHKQEYTEKQVETLFYYGTMYGYKFLKTDSYPWWTKKIVNHAKIGETKEYKTLSRVLPIPLAQYMTSLLLDYDGSMMVYTFQKENYLLHRTDEHLNYLKYSERQ